MRVEAFRSRAWRERPALSALRIARRAAHLHSAEQRAGGESRQALCDQGCLSEARRLDFSADAVVCARSALPSCAFCFTAASGWTSPIAQQQQQSSRMMTRSRENVPRNHR